MCDPEVADILTFLDNKKIAGRGQKKRGWAGGWGRSNFFALKHSPKGKGVPHIPYGDKIIKTLVKKVAHPDIHPTDNFGRVAQLKLTINVALTFMTWKDLEVFQCLVPISIKNIFKNMYF